MTTIQEVEKVLQSFSSNELAQRWLQDDEAKKRLAQHYDDWMSDVHDHKMPLSLKDDIEICLDIPEYIGYTRTPAN